jgi:SWI/SNF-related matrix-associated actin-dependent regulator of chromatin subfamily A3
MLRRECGWALHDSQNDIWSTRTCPLGFTTYFNNITEESQFEPPPEFRGGILADHMGLGKSLSMIALIASDQTHTQLDPDASVLPSGRPPSRKKSVRSYHPTTLLIIPSSLIQTWDTQLIRHLHHGALRWFKHHGTQRLTKVSRLHDYDIVISTFQTVSSEYKSHSTGSSVLFSTIWHRIVLDEAHCIRNQNTITAKAICTLQGRSRWAMTGTPIQNRLPDLMSLLKFLRPYPFSDSKIFQTHVIDVWKTHSDDAAIRRLKKLIKCLSLRRSKCPIDLPERNDMIVYIEFSHAELMKYRQLENPTLEMIDEALCSDRVQAESYMHALSRINVLRMICNLGLSAKSNLDAPAQGLSSDPTMVQEAFEELASLGQAYCTICSLDLELALEETPISLGNSPQASFTTCLRLICAKCTYQPLEDATASVCVCKPGLTCLLTPIFTKAPISSPALPSSKPVIEDDSPTKVTTLIAQLECVKDEKR